MKKFRVVVIIVLLAVLLAIAAPFIVHRRGWISTGQSEHMSVSSSAQTPPVSTTSSPLALPSPSASPNQKFAQSSAPPVPPPPASDLPSGTSSLPLLSVIGFGILVGGVISALRTRSAHR